MNCLDVHCVSPLSLSFTKSSQDMFTESQYAAQMGNVSGKSQCADFRMDATFRSYQPTNEVATCPWTFVKNVDHDRVPTELWEAKCACRCGLHNPDCLLYRCVPVYTYITVLRRKNCMNVSQEIFPLSVGCTQVRLVRRLDANQMIPWNKEAHRENSTIVSKLIETTHHRLQLQYGLLYTCMLFTHCKIFILDVCIQKKLWCFFMWCSIKCLFFYFLHTILFCTSFVLPYSNKIQHFYIFQSYLLLFIFHLFFLCCLPSNNSPATYAMHEWIMQS